MNLASTSIKFISQLANNSDSIAPMATKDTISNAAIVYTYSKEGGKDDAVERAIEEFGTGIVWLLAIPTLKDKIDKYLYPKLKLNPNVDCRNLSKEFIEKAKNAENITQSEKDFFNSLDKKLISKYKSTFLGKFAFSTLVSAALLVGIIKYKQQRTQKRIEKDILSSQTSEILLNKNIKDEKISKDFHSNSKKQSDNKNKTISFKGALSKLSNFMYNPILNTSLLDGVITSTRLLQARKGERKEVLLKEIFQIIFIYCLAKPIQLAFEFIGDKFKRPIQLDPELLYDKSLSKNLNESKDKVQELLSSIQGVDKKKAQEILKEAVYKLDIKKDKALLELLEKNKAINLVKEGDNIKGLSYFKFIDGADVKKSLEGFDKTYKNIDKLNGLTGIKNCKVAAVILNVLFAAWVMGRVQPKLNIWMRKFLNNGDNRNPAIVQAEEEMKRKQQGLNLSQTA